VGFLELTTYKNPYNKDFGNHEHGKKSMSELEYAQNQLSQIYRWIERHNQDGFIDSLTYTQNLDRCVDALYDKLEIAERQNKKSLQ
jgi:hypothetical protein